jgi:2'-hydroxyisoflavone reductase
MRILVIGGSSFVGRAIVQASLDRGHDVTLFNRGKTDPDAFPNAEHLVGDRNTDRSALEGRSFDATVDVCAYVPGQVRSLLGTLGAGAGHYTFISTISVYDAKQAAPSFDEYSPLLEPAWDDEMKMEKYGELKVGCEQVARELTGDRLLVIRPGYVLGPHDPTHRFTYWVERVAEGRSPMAGPDKDQPLQGVDARDLAAFTVARIEAGAVDAYHVTAPDPAPTFAEVLAQIAAGADVELPEIVWVGFQPELPLSAPGDFSALMQASLDHARADGLTYRSLAETARDTLEWVRAARAAGSYQPRAGVGASPEREQELIDR